MPLNTTEPEIQDQVAEDIAEKLKNELKFQKQLTDLYERIAKDIESSILNFGSLPDINIYIDSLEAILRRLYKNVNNDFLGRTLDFFLDNKDNREDPVIVDFFALSDAFGLTFDQLIASMKSETNLNSRVFIDENVIEDSTNILNGIQDLGTLLFLTSFSELFESLERRPTNQELSEDTGKRFRSRIQGKASTAATTSVQNAAEGTKDIERQVFISSAESGTALSAGVILLIDEVWVTVGDEFVRPGHAEADGQLKEDGVFIVQNEQLRFPRDTSLGASLGNIINCRCTVFIVIRSQNS